MTGQLIWIFGILIILVFILKYLGSSSFKGKSGEAIVKFWVKKFLDPNKYRIISDVIFKSGDGTTQIDHIVVSEYGIFVIETKNMKGWIFGSKDSEMWTQKIYNYSKKFQNPLRQNYKHVMTMRELLGVNKNYIHSIVLFVGDSTFKTEMPENVFSNISSCARYITSKTEKVFDEKQINQVIEKIEKSRLEPSLEVRKQHIRTVKKIKNNR